MQPEGPGHSLKINNILKYTHLHVKVLHSKPYLKVLQVLLYIHFISITDELTRKQCFDFVAYQDGADVTILFTVGWFNFTV